MTTKSKKSLFKFKFQNNDIILLGRESKGVPDYVHEDISFKLKIPISNKTRSLNVSQAASISAVEALNKLKKYKMNIEDKKEFSDKWFSYLQEQICSTFEKIEKALK